jgi:hypothetical protein
MTTYFFVAAREREKVHRKQELIRIYRRSEGGEKSAWKSAAAAGGEKERGDPSIGTAHGVDETSCRRLDEEGGAQQAIRVAGAGGEVGIAVPSAITALDR